MRGGIHSGLLVLVNAEHPIRGAERPVLALSLIHIFGGDNAVRIHYAGAALGIALAHVYALKARDAGLGNAEVVYAEAPYDAGAQPRICLLYTSSCV